MRQSQPATPAQAIASVRAAIGNAQTSGQLDPAAANDLNHRLDDIAQSLSSNDVQGAAQKTADMLQHLGDQGGQGGQVGSGAVAQIAAPLNQLATLLGTTPAAPAAPAHGKGHGNKGHNEND